MIYYNKKVLYYLPTLLIIPAAYYGIKYKRSIQKRKLQLLSEYDPLHYSSPEFNSLSKAITQSSLTKNVNFESKSPTGFIDNFDPTKETSFINRRYKKPPFILDIIKENT